MTRWSGRKSYPRKGRTTPGQSVAGMSSADTSCTSRKHWAHNGPPSTQYSWFPRSSRRADSPCLPSSRYTRIERRPVGTGRPGIPCIAPTWLSQIAHSHTEAPSSPLRCRKSPPDKGCTTSVRFHPGTCRSRMKYTGSLQNLVGTSPQRSSCTEDHRRSRTCPPSRSCNWAIPTVTTYPTHT
jgi:hypothetical protein